MVVINEVALLLNIKYSYFIDPTITMVLGNKAIVWAVSVSPSLLFQRYKVPSWIIYLHFGALVFDTDADATAGHTLLVQTRGARQGLYTLLHTKYSHRNSYEVLDSLKRPS